VSAIVHPLYADFKRETSIERPLSAIARDPWHPGWVRKAFALVVAALALATAASAATGPTLKLVSENDPMIVQGKGFRAKERVRLVVKVARPAVTWRRTATATRRGTFQAVVGLVQTGRCGFNVRATGSHGSVATLKSPPLPACMP
jgi:hypothetical protein